MNSETPSPIVPSPPPRPSESSAPENPEARAHDILVRWENRHELLRFELDGWCAWPTLRFAIGLVLSGIPLGPPRRRGGMDRTALVRQAMVHLVAWAGAQPAKIAVITHDSTLLDCIDGRHHDVLFDELLFSIDSGFKIQHLTNARFAAARRAAARPADLTTTALKAGAQTLGRLVGSRDVTRTARAISAILQAEQAPAAALAVIEPTLTRFLWQKRLYSRLFRRLSPEKLLLTTAYGDHAPVAAARELGICTIDVQHGLVTPWNWGYSFTAAARPFRDRMPVTDRIFLHGEHWRDQLTALDFWRDSLRVVGSLRVDRFRRLDVARAPEMNTLVVTTQGYDQHHVVKFLSGVLDAAAGRRPFRVIIKLHPMEIDAEFYYRHLGRSDKLTVLQSAEGPSTMELLRAADLHASIASACHYEALALGVPTAILPFTNHEIVLPLTRTGFAYLVNTPAELHEILSGPIPQVPPELSSYYYRPGALENMKTELAAP